jgi:hypothetical protein
LQRLFRTVGHDLGVHLAAALEEAEDDRFAARAPAPFAAHKARPEVGLVEFDRTADELLGRSGLRLNHQVPSHFEEELIARTLNPVSRAVSEAVKCRAN